MPVASGPRSPGAAAQHLLAMLALCVLGAAIIVSVGVALSVPDESPARRVGVGLTAYLLFVAASAGGGFLGFVFGLPRARLADQISSGALDSKAPGSTASTHYLANSNLIKVSDWLTTIIIGLGLVNLGGLVPGVATVGAALKDPLGGMPYSGIVGVSMIVVGVLVGFLLVYLWTVLRMRELLENSER